MDTCELSGRAGRKKGFVNFVISFAESPMNNIIHMSISYLF